MEPTDTDEAKTETAAETETPKRLVTVAHWLGCELIRVIYDGIGSEIRIGGTTLVFSVVLPIRSVGTVRIAIESARMTLSTPGERIDVIHGKAVTRIPIRRMGEVGAGSEAYAGKKRFGIRANSNNKKEFDASTEIEYAQCQMLTHRNRAESASTPKQSVYETLIRKPNPYVEAIDDQIGFLANIDFWAESLTMPRTIAHLNISAEGDLIFLNRDNIPLNSIAKCMARRTLRRHGWKTDQTSSCAFLMEIEE